MHDDKVIERLGGGAAVVAALRQMFPDRRKLTPHAVYMWKRRKDIPEAWRYAVAQVAIAKKMAGFNADAFLRRDDPFKRARKGEAA